jgi:Phosphorylase superfamily
MLRRLLIFTALQLEARAIARQLRLSLTTPTQYIGQPTPDLSIHLHVIGLRGMHLPDIRKQPIAIILAGLAGGLDPALRIGDVIVDENAEKIYCADKLISTPREKSELFRSSGAMAVDMESAIVRQFAQHRAIPFIHVRSVSDTADETLDPALLGLIDEIGRLQLGKIVATIVRQPTLLGDLLRLRARSRIALATLASAVERRVESV